MKESIVDHLLCTSGFLPPRNEEEMKTFEKIYSGVVVKKDFHVDVDQITVKACGIKLNTQAFAGVSMSAADIHMAARNYEALPKDVIEKIKKQHNDSND